MPYLKCSQPGCKSEKGESNHWWIVSELSQLGGQFTGKSCLIIREMGPGDDEKDAICGQSCGSKRVSQFMGRAQ